MLESTVSLASNSATGLVFIVSTLSIALVDELVREDLYQKIVLILASSWVQSHSVEYGNISMIVKH